MPEQITRDRAAEIVRECYTAGQPQRDAVTLTGYSATWVAAEYRRLRTRGIAAVPGQLEIGLFDTAGG
jgi:hypothetical protein